MEILPANHYVYRSISDYFFKLEINKIFKWLFFARYTDEGFRISILGRCVTNCSGDKGVVWSNTFDHIFNHVVRKYYIQEYEMIEILFPAKRSRTKFENWMRQNDYVYRKVRFTPTHHVYLIDRNTPIENYKITAKILKQEEPAN